jgi:hypothetical protein
MKKSDRKDIHTALVAAKKYLFTSEDIHCEQGCSKSSFICIAMRTAWNNKDITWGEYNKAADMISERLGLYIFLDEWVKDNIGHRAYYECSATEFQAYRWRWLESMIEEFSK